MILQLCRALDIRIGGGNFKYAKEKSTLSMNEAKREVTTQSCRSMVGGLGLLFHGTTSRGKHARIAQPGIRQHCCGKERLQCKYTTRY